MTVMGMEHGDPHAGFMDEAELFDLTREYFWWDVDVQVVK